MTARRKSIFKALAIGVGCLLGVLLLFGILASRGLSDMQELEIKDVEVTQLADGEYIGEFEAYRWSNRVRVTVEDQRIIEVVPLDEDDSVLKRMAGQNYVSKLIARIEKQQTPAVDAVSGSTVSSNAFLKAVERALTGGE